MDSVRKYNSCNDIPSSQTFRTYVGRRVMIVGIPAELRNEYPLNHSVCNFRLVDY